MEAISGYLLSETAHCTLHTTHCSLHTTHYTLHTIPYTLHTAQCILHTTHFTLHTAFWILHTAHCTLHTAHYTLPTTQNTLQTVHSTVQSTVHCTVHCTALAYETQRNCAHLNTLQHHLLIFSSPDFPSSPPQPSITSSSFTWSSPWFLINISLSPFIHIINYFFRLRLSLEIPHHKYCRMENFCRCCWWCLWWCWCRCWCWGWCLWWCWCRHGKCHKHHKHACFKMSVLGKLLTLNICCLSYFLCVAISIFIWYNFVGK